MTDLNPPRMLDELPEKIWTAWLSLGAEFDDRHHGQMQRAWERNEMPYPLVNASSVRRIARESVPVERFPGWSEAIGRLLEDKAAKAKDSFLLGALANFLDGAMLFQMPLLYSGIIAQPSTRVIPDTIPRDHAERLRLAAVLPALEHATIQRRLLTVLARNLANKRSDPTTGQRDALLASLLPDLPDEVFAFTEQARWGADLAKEFVGPLGDQGLLEQLMRRGNSQLRRAAIERQDSLRWEQPRDWSRVIDLVAKYPDDFVAMDAYLDSLICLETLWDATTDCKLRDFAVRNLFTLLEDTYSNDSEGVKVNRPNPEKCLDLLERMLAEEVSRVMQAIAGDDYWPNLLISLSPAPLYDLWQRQLPPLAELFLPALGYRFRESPYYENYGNDEDWAENDLDNEDVKYNESRHEAAARLVRSVLPARREQLAGIKSTELAPMLAFVDSEELIRELSEDLKPIAAKSKPVQKQLGVRFGRLNAALVAELGWLGDKRKGVRTVALEALLQNPGRDAAPLLRQLHADKKTNDADRERILARLEKLGVATEGLPKSGGLRLDELEEKAVKAKIRPQIHTLWSSPLAELLQPLDENVGRWLLNLVLETKEDRLPKLAATTLGHLSRENQARLVEHLVNLWIAGNGDRKLRWLVLFVPGFGDDRIVDALFEAFKGWHKRAKPKAVFAIETLAALDTPYALSQVYEVYTRNSYSYALQGAADKALKAAARRRGVGLLDLADELTPDFGLKPRGLLLDVGPFGYTVTLGTDLSLYVHNDNTGKVTKSLPKAKAGEDSEKRAVAESQFKFLRGNLKKVARQQAKRLQEAMICQRNWPTARWRTLFLEHPVLGVMGQGLIWVRHDEQGNRRESFRISEDRSLVNAEDDSVGLKQCDRVSLWHPVTASDTEADAWRQYLQDYEIKPFLDQIGQPRLRLTDAEAKADQLTRFSGVEVEQFIVKRYLESWNYHIHDQDGSAIGSYARQFQLAGVTVVLELDRIDVYSLRGDSSRLGTFAFYRDGYDRVTLGELPPALIATVLGQGEALRAKQAADKAA